MTSHVTCHVTCLFISHCSFSRPLLVILDRNFDLATPLHHTWTYQALVHDVMVREIKGEGRERGMGGGGGGGVGVKEGRGRKVGGGGRKKMGVYMVNTMDVRNLYSCRQI